MKTFFIENETNFKYPVIPYQKIKERCLEKDYILSLIFVTKERIKKLNLIYRNKDKSTDILSFPIEDNEGEIYISLEDAKEEAKKFDRNFKNFIAFLFIHGCIHLKGLDHGSTMENIESKIREEFCI